MRVTKEQIVKGIAAFADTDVIPKIEDRSTKIIVDIAVQYIKSNKKLADALLGNSIISMMLDQDEDGTFEIETMFESISESLKKYGPFPMTIPEIPIIHPEVSYLKFSEADIEELKKKIERSV